MSVINRSEILLEVKLDQGQAECLKVMKLNLPNHQDFMDSTGCCWKHADIIITLLKDMGSAI